MKKYYGNTVNHINIIINNIAIIIPARWESSRLNTKLSIKFNDKPVILHAYEQVLKCKNLKNLTKKLYLFLDSNETIIDTMSDYYSSLILNIKDCKNGTENDDFNIIVNI